MSQLNVDTLGAQTGTSISVASGHTISGHISQVVNATDTTVASYTSTAGQGQKLGSLQLSITPKSTSSKIFIYS